MSEVKWIKITTDIFDDEKIQLIENLPDAYEMIVVWFKLLCLAGKQNNCGVFIMNDRIPYTDKMLATIFRMKEATVSMALKTFEQFGMIAMIDGVITIPNWEKHQNIEKLEKIREQTRERVARHREKQIEITDVTQNVTLRNATDKIRIDKNRLDKNIPPISPVNLFEDFWSAYPKKKNRPNAERAYCKVIMDDAHITEADLVISSKNYADAISILGTEERFIKNPDRFITDNTFIDYLESNYKKPSAVKTTVKQNQFNQFPQRNYDFEDLEKKLLSK